jgi:hypothetical protein
MSKGIYPIAASALLLFMLPIGLGCASSPLKPQAKCIPPRTPVTLTGRMFIRLYPLVPAPKSGIKEPGYSVISLVLLDSPICIVSAAGSKALHEPNYEVLIDVFPEESRSLDQFEGKRVKVTGVFVKHIWESFARVSLALEAIEVESTTETKAP